jgi:hypothetical protein
MGSMKSAMGIHLVAVDRYEGTRSGWTYTMVQKKNCER